MSIARRVDPASGSTLELTPEGVRVVTTAGERAFLPAPEGYSLSHFAEGATIVGRGAAPVDGWWDWHFEPDLAAGALRRSGPAY